MDSGVAAACNSARSSRSRPDPARRVLGPAPLPSRRRVLLVFVDGIGIGAADAETNPFAAAHLPVLDALLGGPLTAAAFAGGGALQSPDAIALPLDATLGVAGRPQSGTGQTALLTGCNAPALFGRHFGPWVPTPLRPLLAERSVFARARAADLPTVYANALPVLPAAVPRRPGAFPLAAHAAGVLDRDTAALRRGEAVASSITHERWPEHSGDDLPEIRAEAAGANLARIAAGAALTAFAHYDTDTAGHRGDLPAAVAALERLDAFLGGLVGALPPEVLLVLTSDHGNLEDVRVGHTLNPVPLIAVGDGRAEFAAPLRSITDVAPALLRRLDISTSRCTV